MERNKTTTRKQEVGRRVREMSKITKEDVTNAIREYVKTSNKYNAMLENIDPIVLTSDFKNSEIYLFGENVEELHKRWRELSTAYIKQGYLK